MSQTRTQTKLNARSILLPYALTLIGSMAIVQIVIALTGGVPSILTGTLTAVVAVGIVVWYWRKLRELSQIRFGGAMAHAIAFVTITTSFNLHAVIRIIGYGSAPRGYEAAAHEMLATPWFGATLGMSAAWGLGLLIALLGSIMSRGWRD